MNLNIIEQKTENIIEPFNCNKLCPLCNKVNKFKVIQHPKKGQTTSGKKCIACTSKKNNQTLKNRNYYKIYYQNHSTELKLKDKERYKKKKEEMNLVKFE